MCLFNLRYSLHSYQVLSGRHRPRDSQLINMTAWLLALTSIQSHYLSFSSPSPLQCLFHSPLDGLVSFVRVDHRARRQTRPTLKLPSINNLNPNYKPWWRRFAILACTIGRSATLKVPSHGRTCSLHGTCSALRFRPKPDASSFDPLCCSCH